METGRWTPEGIQILKSETNAFLKKLDLELPYGPAIALLGIYPKDLKIGTQKSTCTRMFLMFLAGRLTKSNMNTVKTVHQLMRG